MNPRVPFYQRTRLAVCYSILFGLSPLVVSKKGGEWKLFTFKKMYIITAISVLSYFVVNANRINVEFKDALTIDNVVYRNLILVVNTGGLLGALMIYCGCYLNRNVTKLVFEKLNNIDILLAKLGVHFHFKRDLLFQAFYLFFQPLTFIIIEILKLGDHSNSFSISRILAQLLYFLTDAQFVLYAVTIKRYYSKINDSLQNIDVSQENVLLHKIRLLMHLHSTLSDTAELVNQIYNLPMLTLSTNELGFMLINGFYAYDAVTKGKYLQTAVGILSFGLYSFKIGQKVAVSQSTSSEGHKIKDVIHKVLLQTRNRLISKELVIFSKQMLHFRVRFMVCGLCALDGTILYWLAGFTPSMMIVLLQFRNSQEPLHCAFNITNLTNVTTN